MKRLFAAMTAALLLASLASGMVAAKDTSNLIGGQWRVFNVMPATSSFWDINKAVDGTNSQSFPVQQFQTTTTGSFAVYLENNYNVPMTEVQTITASANWTDGTYVTRGPASDGAYARVWFQDVTSGTYSSNDLWWYHGSLNLNTLTSGTITAPLRDRANWSNVCGKSATDTGNYSGPNCVGSIDDATTPYDGFTNAMTNVKQIGISFGRGGAYASGIARLGGTGIFTMTTFTVTP